jgi:NAD(P)-dependent dehydrogenase (short-subunit alcohol dehydrogenase family)
MSQRVVLVTGASSGIGKSTASLLAKRGFRVFGTSRKPQRERNGGFELLPLDVQSDSSVLECVSEVIAKAGRVDILVNNAGNVLTGAIEETSIDEAKAHFETNFFGAARMVNAVLPDMRKRKNGVIVNISSMAINFPVPFEGYYAAAKAALLAYSDALRQEVRNFNIKVSVVEPGFFRTNLQNARMRTAKSIEDYGAMETRVLSRLKESLEAGGDPRTVAETIERIVETPSPGFRYAVGKEKQYLTAKRILPDSIIESFSRRHWGLDA